MAKNTIDTSPVNQGLSGNQFFPVKVGKIILDGSTDFAADYGGYDSVGTIFYTKVGSKSKLTENETYNEANIDTRFDGIARPLFPFMRYYPLLNEIVLVLTSVSKDSIGGGKETQDYYLPNINIWNHPHHNNYPSLQNYSELEIKKNKEYEKAGLLRRITDEANLPDIPLGDYFKEKINIKPLLPYEGDLIFEGRHGNSLRFGSTSKDKEIIPEEQENNYSYGSGENGDPITILRNGQAEGLDEKGWIHTVEDINRDPSCIYLTSNQVITEFLPSSLNWRSYKAVVAPDPQEEVQVMIDSPADFVTEEEPEEEIAEQVIVEETEEEVIVDEQLADEEEEEIVDPTTGNVDEVASGTKGDQEEEDDAQYGSLYDELEDNFDEDELITFENTEVSGTTLDDDDFKEELKFKKGSTTKKKSSGSNKDGGSGSSSSSDKPNGYPCTINARRHSTSQTLNKPVNATEIEKQIANDPGGRNVKYLMLHTTAMYLKHSHIDVTWFFLRKRDGGWSKHGYHITVQSDGTAMFNLPFKTGSNGCGGSYNPSIKNSNAINISWIGGADKLDITSEQALTYKKVIKAIIKKYPDIKVVGHNQVAAKACPWWWAPKYSELIGLKEKNILRERWICLKKNAKGKCIKFGLGKAITEKKYITGAATAADPSKCSKGTVDFAYLNNVANTKTEIA